MQKRNAAVHIPRVPFLQKPHSFNLSAPGRGGTNGAAPIHCARVAVALALLFLMLGVNTSTLPAQWVQTNGPYGALVNCLAVGPNGEGGLNVFAGTEVGIFLSKDNAASWTKASAGLPNRVIASLSVVDSNIYAGLENEGVFRSTDNGASWRATNAGLPDNGSPWPTVFAFAASRDGTGRTTLFAGCSYGGVFRSTDKGTSWSASSEGLTDPYLSTLVASPNNAGGATLFAGTYGSGGGIFRSTDNGSSWTRVYANTENVWIATLAVTPDGTGGTYLFAGTSYGGSLLRSHDNGATWITTGLKDPVDDIGVNGFAVSGTTLIAGTDFGVYRSTDYGASWTWMQSGLEYPFPHAYAVGSDAAESTYIYGATYGKGVLRSTDNGTSWTAANSGMLATDVRALVVSPDGAGGTKLLAGTDGNGIQVTANEGVSWAKSGSLANNMVIALASCPDGKGGKRLIAGGAGGAFVSTDHGTTWHWAGNGMMYPSDEIATVQALIATPDASGGTNLFAGTDWDGLYRSTDYGNSWTKINTALTQNSVMAFAFKDTNLFVGTDVGVLRTTDNGTSWIGTSLNARVFALAVSDTILLAGTEFDTYRSTDNGATWSRARTGLTQPHVRAFATAPTGSGGTTLFAGTVGGGVYLSTNNGASWVSTDFTGLNVMALAIMDSNLYAGTDGSGVWRRPLSELSKMVTSSEVLSTDLPAQFSLNQNYPNPFNPTTTIRYAVPERAHARLTVFNALGQEVATLVNGEVPAGVHEARFESRGLASGVYFYRLTAGSFVQTRKLTLIR